MNDARIAELLRMSVELDEFERDAATSGPGEPAQPQLRLTHESASRETAGAPRRRRVSLAIIGIGSIAAAACLGIAMTAAVLSIMPKRSAETPQQAATAQRDKAAQDALKIVKDDPNFRKLFAQPDSAPIVATIPVPAPSTQRVPGAATVPVAAGMGDDEQCCVVVALVRDVTGILRCVEWRQHEWDVQRISRMNALDLKSAVGPSCALGPTQVVLVAISGPTRLLPRTDESASTLARCILGGPRGCETEGMCFMGAAARCLPADVSVKIETVALGR